MTVVIDLVGDDEQVLDEKQAVMDNHEDKFAEIIERLQQLQPELKAAPSVAHPTSHSHHLRKRLNLIEMILCSVKDKIKGLTCRPNVDSCLLRQLIEQVGILTQDLSDLTQDIWSSKQEVEDLLARRLDFVRLCSI